MSVEHTAGAFTQRESQYEANKHTIMADGRWLLDVLHNGEELVERQRENLRRMVAAWNACAGIPTDSLEADGVASMANSASLVREIAELRARVAVLSGGAA